MFLKRVEKELWASFLAIASGNPQKETMSQFLRTYLVLENQYPVTSQGLDWFINGRWYYFRMHKL
jgi:hypothetical protein